MQERLIGYSGFNFTKEKTVLLEKLATSLGVRLREIPHGSTNIYDFVGCEALAGDFDLSMLENAADMKWFHSNWAGVDKLIKLKPFQTQKAILTNSAGAYNTMVAEHLLASCFVLLRNFHIYRDAQREHKWLDVVPAETICGKRITVLGVGNTGNCFARMANTLGAKVSGVDLMMNEKPEWLTDLYPIDRLPDALANTQMLIMCLPYTPETDKIISKKEIALMPKGSFVLNTGRGKTLDIDALAEALKHGHLAGAAVDVFPEEPLQQDNPLWNTPNLFITPHIAGHEADRENAEHIFAILAENLRHWVNHEPLVNVVNISRGF